MESWITASFTSASLCVIKNVLVLHVKDGNVMSLPIGYCFNECNWSIYESVKMKMSFQEEN